MQLYMPAAVPHLGDGEGRAPLVLKDVEADAALAVDVGVVHLRLEGHLRGLEGVVCWCGKGAGVEADGAQVRREPIAESLPLMLKRRVCWSLRPQLAADAYAKLVTPPAHCRLCMRPQRLGCY